LLGACDELARSRRLRARAASCSDTSAGATCDDVGCPDPHGCLACVPGGVCGDPNRCNDRNQPAAAVVELDDPIPIFVVDDASPLLQEPNFDVRPELSDIEG